MRAKVERDMHGAESVAAIMKRSVAQKAPLELRENLFVGVVAESA